MNIKFKEQAYQTKAVDAVVECFKGQTKTIGLKYKVDPGVVKKEKNRQSSIDEINIPDGIKNSELCIESSQILENIQAVQQKDDLTISDELKATSVSNINLEIEMETGTGKTYVYIKTMFELNEKYGWNKFIIVVPSIAIREGVYQSFDLTATHFKDKYSKQIKPFIYNSKSLHEIESYSTDSGINVMIINTQAFNARGKDARKIYEELDSFGSRRPIDIIKANRPILIIDEPQKIDGDIKKESKSYQSLKEFDPLFILSYSATHKKIRNKIHRLDALDAYNKKLVKKIKVKGISVKGLSGSDAYLYLQNIVISASKPPIAKLEIEIKQKNNIQRKLRNINVNDDLYTMSDGLEQYNEGFVVSEINPLTNTISFLNGETISCGDAIGDVNESTLRRLQIKEAIKAHLEKEQELFYKGIKVLSLFFIDEVAKYRVYEDDNETNGEYAKYFEDEYKEAIKELGSLLNPEYQKYINDIAVSDTHNGYFSQDKNKKYINSKEKTTGEMKGQSDDVSAYDLILKDKKRLLSFEEPTRFIFSHSALREGWDNPNVFVICTLKNPVVNDNSEATRRQEVGRGLRICVDKFGNRVDNPSIVHDINILTVVANESYKDFVSALQKDIRDTLSSRPIKANQEYFENKTIETQNGNKKIDTREAKLIERYLSSNNYIDIDDKITDIYHTAKKELTLAMLPDELVPYKEEIYRLIDSVFTENSLNDMVSNERETKTNPRNSNFDKKEFQELWSKINQKAVYTVHYNSDELKNKCVAKLNKELNVKALTYTIVTGQMDIMDQDKLDKNENFTKINNQTITDNSTTNSKVKYDLIGKISANTKLTRLTVGKILKELSIKVFNQYKINPEDFISMASRLINEEKATTVIEHLTYDTINETHDIEDIFTLNQDNTNFTKAKKVNKHIYDYITTDSKNERDFVDTLDIDNEKIVVYAKLPNTFFIPTPVGEYNPDWAIAFHKGTVKHIYFIAETKGSMSSMQLRDIEKVKIKCAERFFKEISNDKVVYKKIDGYDELIKLVSID